MFTFFFFFWKTIIVRRKDGGILTGIKICTVKQSTSVTTTGRQKIISWLRSVCSGEVSKGCKKWRNWTRLRSKRDSWELKFLGVIRPPFMKFERQRKMRHFPIERGIWVNKSKQRIEGMENVVRKRSCHGIFFLRDSGQGEQKFYEDV